MKIRSKLRILSWVTTVAMILSIFNVPLLGYATDGTEEGTEDKVSYSVYVQDPYYGEDIALNDSDGFTIENIDSCNQYDGTPYHVYYISVDGYDDEGNENEIPSGSNIVVSSSDAEVALVADGLEAYFEDSYQNATITPNGTYTYFCIFYTGVGETTITVTIDGKNIMSFPLSVISLEESNENENDWGEEPPYPMFGINYQDGDSEIWTSISFDENYVGEVYITNTYNSDEGLSITIYESDDSIISPDISEVVWNEDRTEGFLNFDYTDEEGNNNTYIVNIYLCEPSDEDDNIDDEPIDDEYCSNCGELWEDCRCWDASIDSLELTYTLINGTEYTETLYYDEENGWGDIILKPYDPEKDITITGTGANGDAISEKVVFGDESESKVIEITSISPDGSGTIGYCLEIYRQLGPIAEVTYYIDGKETTITRHYNYENSRYVGIPYAYDSDKEISVVITHLDGTIETPEINWEGSQYGTIWFDSVVNETESTFYLEIYLEDPSPNADCEMRIEAFDSDENGYGFSIDSKSAAGEEGTVVTIPYGYNDRVEFYAAPENDYAQLEGFYLEGEEEKGYILVSAGDTRTFKVIAQNGEEQTYTVSFIDSEGTSADVEMYVSIRDEALAESDWYGSHREIPVDFSEDEAGNKSAEVILPYGYDDEYGIELCKESNDNYSFSYEDSWFYLGEDDEETVEFTVTSPNGETTKNYKIKFVRESEENSKKTELETFTLAYVDENGDRQILDIDAADASDEDGAIVTIPDSAIPTDADEYYVDVYAKLAGYTYVYNAETNADNYDGGWDQDYVKYSVDLSWQRSVTITFDVMASNGLDITPYKVKLVNGAKAGIADIDEVKIEYTRINEEETYRDYIWLDEEGKTGKCTLYPYNTEMPIILLGEGADGSKIYEFVTFEEGENEAIVTFVSTSPNGENTIEYTVTVIKPEHPLAYVSYQNAAYGESIECDFSDDYQDKVYIPYNYDQEYGINFDITLLDGSKIDSPEIIWETEVREDEHDPLYGKVQFKAAGKTYTIDIVVEGISSDTNAYMYMRAWDGVSYDEWGDEVYRHIFIDSEAASSEEGVVVTIPYGCEDNARFYIEADYQYANVEGYDEDGNEYSSYVSAGETRVYTVTAQDGTVQDFKITFIASGGNSTDIEAEIYFTNTTRDEYQYNCFDFLYFEENEEGIMETNVVLPYNYSNEDGIMLYDYSSEQVTYNIPLEEKIIIDIDNDPSFEFTVTSPNGNVTKDYVINFSKETAEEAAVAELDYMFVNYTTGNGERLEEEVDILSDGNDNIIVYLPEDIYIGEDVYVTFEAATKGYAYISYGEKFFDFITAGDVGAYYFLASFLPNIDTPGSFSFEVISSNGENVKEYTVEIKYGKNVHECIWNEGEITVEPTCTENGERILTCQYDGCDETKTEVVQATGHTEVIDETVDATCTSTGLTEGKHCSVCKEVLVAQEVVKATGHTEEIDEAVVATCTATGLTEGKHCSVCKEVLVAQEVVKATGHTEEIDEAVAATCTATGLTEGKHCSTCEEILAAQKEVPMIDHSYGEYKTTTKAKFGKAGVQTATCSACSDKRTRSIAAPKTIKLSYTSCTYNGGVKKPSVTVYDTNGKKISSSNYKVSYASGRKNVGKYKVTVTIKDGRANYAKSSKYTTFKINPKGTSISKLTKGKKSFTVKWKKQPGKMATSRITGYQYRYSTSSKMTNAKTVTVKGYSKTSAKKTKLKAYKKYYVQVRTYKTVNGTKYYSSWSKSKTVTTK